MQLRFLPKADKDPRLLREGVVDLETGVVDPGTSPELRTQALFRDRYIGAVREGHPLARGPMTAARYAAGRHVLFSRQGSRAGRGSTRRWRRSGSRARSRPSSAASRPRWPWRARRTSSRASPRGTPPRCATACVSFALPFAAPEITVSMLWHPRLDADPAHRWLRGCLRDVIAADDARPVPEAKATARRTAVTRRRARG